MLPQWGLNATNNHTLSVVLHWDVIPSKIPTTVLVIIKRVMIPWVRIEPPTIYRVEIHELITRVGFFETGTQRRKLHYLPQFLRGWTRRIAGGTGHCQWRWRRRLRQRRRGGGGGRRRRWRRFGINVENRHRSGFGGSSLNISGWFGRGSGEGSGEVREVEDGGVAFNGEGGDVVSTRGHFGGGEGAEPDPIFLPGFADFGDPFAPGSHSDSSVNRVLGVAATIPSSLELPLLLWGGSFRGSGV